jgi:hypothetical protein
MASLLGRSLALLALFALTACTGATPSPTIPVGSEQPVVLAAL